MIDHSMEFFMFGLCLIFSGFYSGSEATIVSISVERARQLMEQGGRGKEALLFLVENQTTVLTTILVGNNLVNIFAAALTTDLANYYFENDAIAISTGVTTFLILVFGEIIPKTFARSNAEVLVYPVIKILQINYYLMFPVIWLFNNFIFKVMGDNAKVSDRVITKDDIEFMVSKAEKEKTMDSKQLEMLNSILEFPTIKVKDIMVPRNDVVYMDKTLPFDDMITRVSDATFSRYPVCDGDLDQTVGFLHIKDVAFLTEAAKQCFDVKSYVKQPFFVYEHMKIQSVFDHMNRRKLHMALVKDENGLVVGIITLEDIIEEIVGEIEDEHDDGLTDNREDLRQGVSVDGKINLRDLYTDYEIKIPLNDNYSTLNGFLLDHLGNKFPEQGQIIVWEGLSFELEEVRNFEIHTVRITDIDGEKHYYSRKDANEVEPA